MHNGHPRVIDCDIHDAVPSIDALFPYLSDHWREYIRTSAFKGPVDTAYPPNAPTTIAPGAERGTSLDVIRRNVLDRLNVEIGILNCEYAVDSLHNPDTAAAVAAAVNDWHVHEWLEPEPRLRASMIVPTRVPDMGAAEIDRVGDHPGLVQVLLPVRSEAPYGNRRYLPIFEAAARHDLVVSLQFGGSPGNAPTGSGWPSYYIEEYVGMAQIFQTQILSMIIEGVFDRFPNLRVALIEGGWTWLPSLMWRIDKDWKGLRREVPWNTAVPSDYVRSRMKLSLQPIDGPGDERHLLQVMDQLGSDELLMWSSDYPHWHDDDLPTGLSESARRKILSENARAFYRL
ncbi:MAG: amidohydrolase [Chloroflexi bacterium]|nr:amidohydrolase [Chloroflexota bacterium]